MPRELLDELDQKGTQQREVTDLDEVLAESDVL